MCLTKPNSMLHFSSRVYCKMTLRRHGAISKADEKPEEKEKFAGSGFVLGNTAQSSQHVPAPKPQGGKVRLDSSPLIGRNLLISLHHRCELSWRFTKTVLLLMTGHPENYRIQLTSLFLMTLTMGNLNWISIAHHLTWCNRIVPRELEALVGQGDLNVELIDKKTEEYKPPPKPAVVAFSGAGQSLGGYVGRCLLRNYPLFLVL